MGINLTLDTQHVIALAHEGLLNSGGGPGPHHGLEKEGAEKGPGLGRGIAEGAAQDPHTEDAPGLQGDIDPHLLPLLD